MIEWFTKNHVAANLMMVAIVIFGLFSLKTRIPLEVFPSFESNVITTSVSLSGATALEIEQSITLLVEQQVAGLEGISSVTSYSSEGRSIVNMEVDENYDKRDILADVKSKIDAINDFPADANSPVSELSIRTRGVISVSLTGDISESRLHKLGEKTRDDLLKISGITQVELERVRDYQFNIDITQSQLHRYNLTLSDIRDAIISSSVNTSAGNLRTSGGDILISTNGTALSVAQFSDIIVKTNQNGSTIRLSDIATIEDGFEETPLKARFNGTSAALIEVYRVGDQSALDVADKVKEYIEKAKHNMPAGVVISHWNDNSKVLKSRLKTLIDNAVQGGILVLVMLSLFLRPSIAFFVFLGIPISFMGAFIVMPFFGLSLNIISLFGFILVLGIVVDDAIVTGENIYRHMQRSESSLQAAIVGTKEVAVAVTFGVLTTVVAFLPITYLEGRRAELFAQIPAIVIPVLLFSLIESKFILPAHLKFMRLRNTDKPPNILSRFQQRFADGFENLIISMYQPLLKKTIRHRYSVLIGFICMFTLLMVFITSGWMRFTFFPRVPSEVATVTLTMPSGTPFDITDAHVKRMVTAALELQEQYRNQDTGESIILDILSTTGSGGGASNRGRVRFETVAPDARDSDDANIPINKLVTQWRKKIGPINGATSLTYRAEIGRGGDPVSVRITGESISQMQLAVVDIRQQLKQYPSVFDITDNLSDGKDELQLELKPQGQLLGVSRSALITQVRQSMQGIEVQSFQRGREDVPVVVRLPLNERDSIADLYNLEIKVGQSLIPLSQLAYIKIVAGPSTLYRTDFSRTVSVVADLDKTQTNATVLNADLRVFLDEIKAAKYPNLDFSLRGEAQEQDESFNSLQWGLVFVFFAIYALLAIPFRSFFQPLIVMSVIPFGAIGAIFGHWIMGMDLTIMSLLGLLALIGVVVNDSLVLVSFVNQEKDKGSDTRAAVLEAGVARFRPVILTSITTFVGLMPLLFEQATQAQFLIPMAVSLSFGILFATVITLLLIPVNYCIIEDIKDYFAPSSSK